MAEPVFFDARVVYKVATEAEWDDITLDTLIKGEFYFYVAEGDPNTVINIKVGDGVRQPKDLPFFWDASLRVPFFGTATPSSTPSPASGSGFWIATEAGTYTNYGGVELPANSIGIITRVGTTYGILIATIDLSGYISTSDITEEPGANGQMYDSALNINDYAVESTGLNPFPTAIASPEIPVKANTQYSLTWLGSYTGSRSGHWLRSGGLRTYVAAISRNSPITSPSDAIGFQFTAKRADENEATFDPTLKFNEGTSRADGDAIFSPVIRAITGKGIVAERADTATTAMSATTAIGLSANAEIQTVGSTPKAVINREWYNGQLGFSPGANGQMYDSATDILDVAINSTGEPASFPTARTSQWIDVKPSTQYSLTWQGSYTGNRSAQWRLEDNSNVYLTSVSRNTPITSPANAVAFRFTSKRTDANESAFDPTLKFNEGTARADGDAIFSPYVSKISGYDISSTVSSGIGLNKKIGSKTVIILGDSASANTDSNTTGRGSVDNNILAAWPAVFAQILGATDVRNTAKWSAYFADQAATTYQTDVLSYTNTSPNNTLSNQVYSLIRKKTEDSSFDPRLIIILGGGNDLTAVADDFDTKFGTLETDIYPSTSYNYTVADLSLSPSNYETLRVRRSTVMGGLRWAIEAILTNFPNATITVCGTLQRASFESRNRRLWEFTRRLKQVSDWYACRYIDTTYQSGFSFFAASRSENGWDGDFYTIDDSTHKNQVGDELIGRFIANDVNNIWFDKPNTNAQITTT